MKYRLRSSFTRRQFMKHIGMVGIIGAAPSVFATNDDARLGNTPSAHSSADAVRRGVFDLLPLGSIRPRGWLKSQLQLQANGLSGHLDETWPDVGPTSGWLGGAGESWERGPYFLDGLVPLAYLLEDARLGAC